MSWTPDPAGFVRDLEAMPSSLRELAAALGDDPWRDVRGHRRVALFGMGSSRFAALPVARRLRRSGIDAVAEYAAAEGSPAGRGTLAVAISASGTTMETVGALARHVEAGSTSVAITNVEASPLQERASHHLPLRAGVEEGQVACRSFVHTLALLLALVDPSSARETAARAADAIEQLLVDRSWVARATEALAPGDPLFLIAPASRISSAAQGALLLREGPRVQADACETADWLHVDVYLTKPLPYRAVLFAGAEHDADVVRWIVERGGRAVAVGTDVAGTAVCVRHRGDDDPDVALLSEVVVPAMLAADTWRRRA